MEGKIMRKLALVSIGVAALALVGCEKKAENVTASPQAAVANATAPVDAGNVSASANTTSPSSSSDGKVAP
jgi:uncharacterized protein YcfL